MSPLCPRWRRDGRTLYFRYMRWMGKRGKTLTASKQFSRLFGSYAKAFNVLHERTGSVFENPFERILVEDEAHLRRLVSYIHQNPQRHGLVDDFKRWPYASYGSLLSRQPTRLSRDDLLSWFDGRRGFIEAHARDQGTDPAVLGDYWARSEVLRT
jgi:putative transposase